MPTPLEEAPASLAGGRRLFLKREDQHELGAFKWRGALPVLRGYREAGAEAVVTASTGNHGAATAWAARRVGMLDEAKDRARAFAAERRLPFFEDGAEPAQFDGYEAIGREVLEQLGRAPDAVVVPVGNGALLIGVARALPASERVGVVAKEAPVMALSVAAGHPVDCDRAATFADGMAVRVAIPLAVTELARLGVRMVEVSERALAHAVGAFDAAGIRVEGSAAAPLAALDALGERDGPIVLIVTGRNIDDELHRRAVERPKSFPP
jgi:threonine dehydratase